MSLVIIVPARYQRNMMTFKTLTYALSFYVKSANIKNGNKRHAYVGPLVLFQAHVMREIRMWYEV